MRIALSILVLLLSIPSLAAAERIYRSTDDQGNPLFTDQPPSNDARPMHLAPLTTVPAVKPGQGNAQAASADAQAGTRPTAPPYTGVRVTYPPAGEAVRHNGGLVPFRVQLQPDGTALKPGHKVRIVLDGDPRASGSSLQVTVSPVNRGPHTVRAQVLDEDGQVVVESPPVKFFLLRASIGNN